jgi:hypothetical protein
MIRSVQRSRHIHSTADGVLSGTPPENYLAFIETAKEVAMAVA